MRARILPLIERLDHKNVILLRRRPRSLVKFHDMIEQLGIEENLYARLLRAMPDGKARELMGVISRASRALRPVDD